MHHFYERICICLEQDTNAAGVRSYRAAAECMRAALFMTDQVLYTPHLAPIAAILARATARARPDSEHRPLETGPRPGVLMPAMSASPTDEILGTHDDVFFAAISRTWSAEESDEFTETGDKWSYVDLFVEVTQPSSDTMLELAELSERRVGFNSLNLPEAVDTMGAVPLDADWQPRPRTDPESGSSARPEDLEPPYGLLLQSYALRERGFDVSG